MTLKLNSYISTKKKCLKKEEGELKAPSLLLKGILDCNATQNKFTCSDIFNFLMLLEET